MEDVNLRPKEEKRPLYTIWEEPEPILRGSLPWKCQLINYIASFPTQLAAEKYVRSVQKERERQEKQRH